MGSSSSSLSRTWSHDVYTSLYGNDVLMRFLSHLRKQFSYDGISMFNYEEIERSQTNARALKQGIRESRISIVVLTKDYASSSLCLDELVEILKCKQDKGQIVMTIFYGVDPADVELGIAFNETYARKTEEEKQRWSQALTDVTKLEGYDIRNWENEAEMIEKISRDVLGMLNAKISWDFGDMVGLEAHLQKIHSLLQLDDEEEAMIFGIYGPAGIGKTSIARALHSRLSHRFQLNCYMGNVGRICYNSDLDGNGLKLKLQEEFLSKIVNHDGKRIDHLRAIPESLRDKKVLVILDAVDDLQQLKALADETSWFGPGSRIIVTTKDPELLRRHGIDITYRVVLPSRKQALEILCRDAFGQSYPPDGFGDLALRVTEFCGKLPLSLRMVGKSLHGKNKEEWEEVLSVGNEPRGRSKNRLPRRHQFAHRDYSSGFRTALFCPQALLRKNLLGNVNSLYYPLPR